MRIARSPMVQSTHGVIMQKKSSLPSYLVIPRQTKLCLWTNPMSWNSWPRTVNTIGGNHPKHTAITRKSCTWRAKQNSHLQGTLATCLATKQTSIGYRDSSEEFEQLAQVKHGINFVYSVRQTCWNLSTRDRCKEFECHHIEADTITFYIYSQVPKSGVLDPVLIDAEDTVIVVLSAFVAQNTEGILAIKHKRVSSAAENVPQGCSRNYCSTSHNFWLWYGIGILWAW